jgi:toxin FitB
VSYLVVDTDVASGLLRQRLSGSMRGQLVGQTLAITFVTLGELTKWTLVRQWGPGRQSAFEEFLASVLSCCRTVRELLGGS